MFRTISEIKAANKRLGRDWFDPGTMRFFNTRVHPKVYGGRYFITSEQFEGSRSRGPRRYSIRKADDNGEISTIGEFGAYNSLGDAEQGMSRLLSYVNPISALGEDVLLSGLAVAGCAGLAWGIYEAFKKPA